MEIGIITFHTPINYGAILQAYALQKYLKSQYPSFNVSIINFKTEEHIKKYNILIPFRRNLFLYFSHQFCILLRYRALSCRKKKFIEFSNNEFNLTERYHTQDELLKKIKKMNIYIVGSDQVFHPKSNYLRAYYLDFPKNDSRKIAYAPSFGSSQFNDNIKQDIGPYLKDFDELSCREKDGALFMKEIVEKDVPVVLDPVFLLNEKQWTEIAIDPKFNEKYIFIYDLNGKEHLINIAKKIQKKTGYRIICQTQSANKFYSIDKQLFDSGPQEFIGLIKNAEYVVTDSFHGTAFSILYRKKQFVYIAMPNAASRIFSLLSLCKLKNRVIDFGRSDDFIFNETEELQDYSSNLEKLIHKSKLYLDHAINA